MPDTIKTKPKFSKTPSTPWKEKFFKTTPMVDAHGNPIPQDPPLTKSFWDKPETTAMILKKKYKRNLK